ncbi:MAG: DinB family protein [Acidobacteriota bacterium]|nr:DinB family protein [Acidobacteriota bacterium]
MTDTDEHGRPETPLAAGETETLLGFLDFQRSTFEWKTRGLDAAGLAVRIAPSTMTLGGMLKHLAFAEDLWFTWRLADAPWPAPFDDAEHWSEPDWEWTSAAEDSPQYLRTLWEESVRRSRGNVADALSRDGLDQLARRERPGRESPSLRWILCHMIEEYARHNGHADLLREIVDGSTGV